MMLDEIKAYLAKADSLPLTYPHFYDLTQGETEAVYIVIGEKFQFVTIEEFAAAALIDVARDKEGDETPRATWSIVNWDSLDAESAEPPSWQVPFYDYTIRPGDSLCFPALEKLDFLPPSPLKRRIYLEPGLSGAEQCIVSESTNHYAFCYWYTTG